MTILIEVNNQNISFQECPLVEFTDKKGWISRIRGFSSAFFKELNSRWQRQYNPLKANAHNLFPSVHPLTNAYDIDEQQWQGSSKLIVLIHGLNSSPLAWSTYLEKISTTIPQVSCFAPFVNKKGYCSCKEAARPILNVVQRYANEYPNNPILLVGHSNGARIAAYIEQKLDAKDIRLISIAGPHYGSKLIGWINVFGLTRCFGFTLNMGEELTYQGNWVTKKLIKWHDRQHVKTTERHVERVFFASSDDWRIFPNKTSFPNLPNSRFYLVDGESHVTIIDAVRRKVLSYT